ncbi:MAG TPA: addiction module protein [Gemmatimonadaceae bacterium]|jgi:putative addiction module component (TIGR02574 family)
MTQPALNYRDLPIPDRLQLVEDIWDSIAQEANAHPETLPLSDAQRAELRTRAADADAHPDEGIPWSSVRDELFGRGG